MTCYRSEDDWHSYIKKNLAEAVLLDMAAHLTHCPECRHTVSLIQETADLLSKGRVTFTPPLDLKINIMMTIDKNKYKENPAYAELKTEQEPLILLTNPKTYTFRKTKDRKNSFQRFDLKNWGLSMVAAGFLLFALNLSSLTVSFKSTQIAELNNELIKQIVLPFDKMSELTHDVLMKIDSLSVYQANLTR
ncbi:anti-sigma factor family protein [Desulfosporosinus sp. SB140]|uniref:anti-sigma factor family protein n=1 Tax=Desulfosporosinus paludis TaxID=3115649 RepID=UPI00388F9582